MNIHRLEDAPPPALAAALERFERQFTYPLGVGRSFHVSHGADYPRFFRAIGGPGAGVSFVAQGKGGEILGTLGVALRALQLPDGGTLACAYLGDLKTVPDARRARVLIALGAEAYSWGRARGAQAAYGVVMDGTPCPPSTYTGRFGLPAFGVSGKVCVLRLPFLASDTEDDSFNSECQSVEICYRGLSRGRFAPLGGGPDWRSGNAPLFLTAPNGRACGVLEDTRLAKRLLLDDGGEMVSAHLSKFAYTDVPAGVFLLRQAMARCDRRALALALFVSVPDVDAAAFLCLLEDVPGIVEAPATIYAAGIASAGQSWNLSTAEI